MTAGSDPGNTQMPIQQQSQSGGPGCLKAMGILTLLMLTALLVLGFLAWNTVGGLFGGISKGVEEFGESVAALPQTVANSVEVALKTELRASLETKVALAEAIRLSGTLVTASHAGDADVKVGIRSGLLNLCGASVNHIVDGTIEAGVDVSQVQEDDFIHDPLTDNWVLQLGAAELHSCRIDYIRQNGHSFTACQQDWDAYRMLAESVALREMRDKALAESLLAKAEQEAQIVLGNFLSAVTRSNNITIVFESEPVTEFPVSCTRELPEGWVFDEESDSWLRE